MSTANRSPRSTPIRNRTGAEAPGTQAPAARGSPPRGGEPRAAGGACLVVGIGSPHGDDQAGWQVAADLASRPLPPLGRVRSAKAPVEILSWLEGVDRLILCDAGRSGRRPGELRRFGWPCGELAETTWSGTHDFSLVATLELADRVGVLPEQVVIWSVESARTGPLEPLSAEVGAAIPRLVRQITTELQTDPSSGGWACTSNR